MQTVLSRASQAQQTMIEKINVWNLTPVRERLIQTDEIPSSVVNEMEKGYRQYLILLALNPDVKFPVSKPVDVFAHQHMLFTRDFENLHENVFAGMMIHHEPTINQKECDELTPLYNERTIPALHGIFGIDGINRNVWTYKAVCFWDLVSVVV